MKEPKYLYEWVLQGDYGYGWDDLTAASDRTEARSLVRDYMANAPDGAYRLVNRREPNPAYVAPPVYVATVNIPGYLPMDDNPPAFANPSDAWDYLRAERERDEDNSDCDRPECIERYEYSDTWQTLLYIAIGGHIHGDPYEDTPTNPDGTGVVYGDTPCMHSSRDLGLAYCVSVVTS